MTADELQRTFSSNIRKFRLQNHLTQMKLAENADLSVGYLCDLENGNKWAAPETIVKIATALHVYPYQLFLAPENEDVTDTLHGNLLAFAEQLKHSIDSNISALIEKNIL